MKRLMPQTQDTARSPAARSEASRSKASSLSDLSAQLRSDDECDTEIETNAMVAWNCDSDLNGNAWPWNANPTL